MSRRGVGRRAAGFGVGGGSFGGTESAWSAPPHVLVRASWVVGPGSPSGGSPDFCFSLRAGGQWMVWTR